MMLVMCAEKVDSDCSMLCSSPMSAKTPSNTDSAAPSAAGTCSPDCAMSTSRPTVFSVTVLPPVLGPVITSTWKSSPTRTSTGTTDSGSSSGWRARRKSSHGWARRHDRRAPPRAGRSRSSAQAKARSSSASTSMVSDSAVSLGRHVRREIAQDPRDLLLLLDLQLPQSVALLHHRQRLDEHRGAAVRGVVHHARHAPALAALHRHHVAAAALGDEGLLQVVLGVARGHQPLQLPQQAVVGHPQLAADAAPGPDWHCPAPGRRRPAPPGWRPGGPGKSSSDCGQGSQVGPQARVSRPQGALQAPGGRQGVADVQQLLGQERLAAPGRFDLGAHVVGATQLRTRTALQEALGLAGAPQAPPNLVCDPRWASGPGPDGARPRRTCGPPGDGVPCETRAHPGSWHSRRPIIARAHAFHQAPTISLHVGVTRGRPPKLPLDRIP